MNIEKVLDKPENKEKLLINRIEGYKKSDSSIVVNKVKELLDSIIYILSLNDEEEEMIKALAFVDEEKFIGLLLYYRNYESMFRDVLFQRLDGMDETKRNKIRKMLDNVKDGQDY